MKLIEKFSVQIQIILYIRNRRYADMNIVGLITEYNPFHKGHEYHIQKAKEITNADACVVIMSGNYVQRGTPAFIDKHTRTGIALNHGADMVFELPLPFACSSAEYFATAAVTLLHKMGVVTHLCFGAECDNIKKLQDIASILADAKLDNAHLLNQYIKDNVNAGIPYAAARSDALARYIDTCGTDTLNDYVSILNKPNNILAIEYLKTLGLLGSDIIPVAIERTKASYHDNSENNPLYSASSVRAAILNNNNAGIDTDTLDKLYAFSPEYKDVMQRTAPITENDISNITSTKLLATCFSQDNILSDYMGVDKDLANRMANRDILLNHTSFNDLIEKLKTKNIAYTSISRALLAITLEIKKSDIESYIDNNISSYIRLLGFRREASIILSKIKQKGNLTIIGQLSEINDKIGLNTIDKQMLSHSIYCDELYNMIVRNKYKCPFINEYQRKIIIQ